jgi:hypothetical protein
MRCGYKARVKVIVSASMDSRNALKTASLGGMAFMMAVSSCLALNLLVVTFVWHDEDMAGGGEGPLAVTAFSHREGESSHPVSSVKDVDWVQTTRRRPGMATGGVVDIYGWVRRVSSYSIVNIHARPESGMAERGRRAL